MYYINGKRRPNKLARGMQATVDRSNHHPAGAALSLVVRGTTDVLASWYMLRKNAPCPCCGSQQKGPRTLTESGRNKLTRLRRHT